MHQILKMIKKNIFSILLALLIMYLSLISSEKFERVPFLNIPFLDKIVHFGMYFLLMSAIIFVNRKTLESTRRLFIISLIPLLYGIMIEVLQSMLTVNRSGSFYDVVFNTSGIYVSILIWLSIKPFKKKRSNWNWFSIVCPFYQIINCLDAE